MGQFSFDKSQNVAWNDFQVDISGSRCTKIRGLKIGGTIDLEHLYAEGGYAIGIQEGNQADTFEMKLLIGDYVIMEKAAQAAGLPDLRRLEFDIIAKWKSAPGRPTRTVTLVGCKVSDISEAVNQNDKSVEITLPGLCLRTIRA